MTERDFAYWLQGYFELRELDAPDLDRDQVDLIKKHIELVRLAEGDHHLINAVESLLALPAVARDQAVTAVLNGYFIHVVDPKDPNFLVADEIHNGKKWTARC